MNTKIRWLASLAFALCSGCTSITSTILQRFDNDAMSGVSNGTPGVHDGARRFVGIPVTVKIPTHLDISIQETLFFVEATENRRLNRQILSRRHLDVVPQLQYSDKIFTVDLKRPAAGQLDYELEYQDERNPQYFKKVSYHVEDETIKDITAVLQGITVANKKPTALPQGSEQGSKKTPPPITAATRTVAWKRFDINAPDFEAQVMAFVNHHLNNCNSCELNCAHCRAPADSAGTVPTRANPTRANPTRANPTPANPES